MRRAVMVFGILAGIAASAVPVTAGAQSSPATPTAGPAIGAVQPGGSVAWRPEGRQVIGRPVVYRGSAGGVDVAWMDPTVLRPVFVPGTGDPGGPWAWGGQVAPEARGQLVAAFNGGFKMGDIAGGWYTEGRTVKSLVIYADGHATVGEWGRDVNLTPDVVAVRQNLQLLVDGGQPTAAAGSPGAWGASVAGVATARSGVGVDANGALISAQARVSPQGLADALVAAGAVRGMELDINPDWTTYVVYDLNADGSVSGRKVMGSGGPGGLYLSPYARDFFALLIKPAVAPGGTGMIGDAVVNATANIKRQQNRSGQ